MYGQPLPQGLLDSYPKRTDLWSIYIDAHSKAHTPPKAPQMHSDHLSKDLACAYPVLHVSYKYA